MSKRDKPFEPVSLEEGTMGTLAEEAFRRLTIGDTGPGTGRGVAHVEHVIA